jgi:3D (Asp-Asp-Asp) domain-containing protein
MVATSVALTIVVGSAIVAKELYVRAGISGPLAAMAPTATSAVAATPASQSGLVNSAATANWEGEISDQAIVPLTPSEEDVLDFAVEMENQPLEVQAPLAPLVSHAKATGQTPTKTTDAKRTNQDLSIRYFNGRPVRPARTISMLVTAYTPDEFCCAGSADGITASLHHVTTNGHALVAADSRVLPLGSMITVPGYDDNQIVPVLDRGGKIKGNRLDVLFPDRQTAKAWGVRRIKVTVWEYADGKGKENWRKVRDSK